MHESNEVKPQLVKCDAIFQHVKKKKKRVIRLMPVPWIRVYFVCLLFKLSTKKCKCVCMLSMRWNEG